MEGGGGRKERVRGRVVGEGKHVFYRNLHRTGGHCTSNLNSLNNIKLF